MSANNVGLKIFLDVLVLACVAAPLLGFFWIEPFQRGFFYDDSSIRLPFTRHQTIPTYMITPLVIAIPIVLIIITEIVHRNSDKNADERYLAGRLISGWIWECYCAIGVFLFGLACQQLVTTIGKYALGRLRPHFYALCRPQITDIVWLPEDRPITYIPAENIRCVGTNDGRLLKNARLSFPSGHSSASMYAAVFLILYMHLYWRWSGSKLFRHGMQLLVFLCAWYVGISRIQDNVHHWDDVAAGFIIGAVIALLMVCYVLKPKKLWKHRHLDFQEAIDQQRDLERAQMGLTEPRLPRAVLVNSGPNMITNSIY